MRCSLVGACALVCSIIACGESETQTFSDTGGGPGDRGVQVDAGDLDGGVDGGVDAGPSTDATPDDFGFVDATTPDLGGAVDAASLPDAAPSDAGLSPTWECVGDQDCAEGTCVELAPGGYRACSIQPMESTQCWAPGLDQCCDTGDCAEGTCLAQPLVPICSGVPPMTDNVCASDFCGSDGDCSSGGLCLPAGVFGRKVRSCLGTLCRLDSDCAARPGGQCRPVRDPCCGFVISLGCVYPDQGCASNADCPNGHCGFDGAEWTCQLGPPLCPA